MTSIGLGGAPVPVAVAERAEALGIHVTRAYGSSEHPSTTGSSPHEPRAKRNATDGHALAGVELRIVDEDGRDLSIGTPGEIWSRGPDLCAGYTNPELTREAFRADGWYASGDIGVLDADGYLTITDRKKDIIIRGGANISAAEIEELVMRLPAVAEVAVVAAPDPRLGERAFAFLRLRPGAPAPDSGNAADAISTAAVWRNRNGRSSSASSTTSRAPLRARSRSSRCATPCGRKRRAIGERAYQLTTPTYQSLLVWSLATLPFMTLVRGRVVGAVWFVGLATTHVSAFVELFEHVRMSEDFQANLAVSLSFVSVLAYFVVAGSPWMRRERPQVSAAWTSLLWAIVLVVGFGLVGVVFYQTVSDTDPLPSLVDRRDGGGGHGPAHRLAIPLPEDSTARARSA